MSPCVFDHAEQVARATWTFWFRPEKPYRYIAGQFIDLYIPGHDKRWFTLSSSPTEQLLSITTKLRDEPSAYKEALQSLRPGDSLTISEPMGDFVLPIDKARPIIFVAAGIGITPVRSMLTFLADSNEKRTVHALYAVSNEDELAFKDLLESAATNVQYLVKHPSTKSTVVSQALTSDSILAATQSLNKPLVYLSGPEEMVELFVAELKEKGVSPSQLVTDYFPGYPGL